MKLTGIVDQITSRTVETRYGQKPVYQMEVEGTWVDLGFGKPKYEEGEHVNLNVEKNKYGKYEITKGAPNGSAASGASHGNTSRNRASESGFPIPADNYQTAIIRQNSMTNAVNLLSATGALKGMDTEVAVAMAINVAYDLADFSSGMREVKQVRHLMGDDAKDTNEDD